MRQLFKSNLIPLQLTKEQLLNEIDKKKCRYSSNSKMLRYLDIWKAAFSNAYDASTVKLLIPDNQYFYESLYIGGGELRLHFNITKALSMVEQCEVQTLPINLFAQTNVDNENAIIKYSEIADLTNISYAESEKPIIVVEYYFGKLPFLVIDGNHRVTMKKQRGVPRISVCALPWRNAYQLPSSKLEQAAYLFTYEGQYLEQYIDCSHATDFL